MTLEPLGGPAQIVRAAGGDPLARSSMRGRRAAGVYGWRDGDAVAWFGWDRTHESRILSAVGPGPAVAALVARVFPYVPHVVEVTVDRNVPARLPATFTITESEDWNLRWTRHAPARVPGENLVEVLTRDEEPEAAELLAVAYPGSHTLPGGPEVRRWVGIRGPDGRLVAAAADTSGTPGAGHMNGVTTSAAARGRGLAAALVARLTRLLLAEFDLVTLGVKPGNTAGRILYDRLGFAERELASVRLTYRAPGCR